MCVVYNERSMYLFAICILKTPEIKGTSLIWLAVKLCLQGTFEAILSLSLISNPLIVIYQYIVFYNLCC